MQENRIFDKNMSIMIKGVAIILMLFHHFFGFPDWIIEGNMFIGLGDNYNCVERKIGLFGAICVELFVFITGYGSYYITKKRNSYKNIIKKILSFLLNYWIILFLFFLPMGYILEQKKIGSLELIKNMFGYDITVVKFAWYVRFYLALQLLFPILLYITKLPPFMSVLSAIVPFGCINYILYFLGLDSRTIVSYIIEFNSYVPVFFVGYFIAQYRIFDKMDKKIKEWNMNNICIYLIALFLIYYLRGRLITYFPNYNPDWIFAPLLIFTCAELIKKVNCVFIEKSLSLIGKHSANLWYIHGIFFYVDKIQFILYLPKISVLILVWSLFIMIPISLLYEYLDKTIEKFIRNRKIINI